MSRNSNIAKLLKKLAKPARKVSGKRLTYSWKQRRQRTYIPLSKQERKLLQEKRASSRDALVTSVLAARNQAYQAAVKMSKDFGEIHKPSYYYRLILQRTRLRQDIRKLSNWNAFVSKETKKHNEGEHAPRPWTCTIFNHLDRDRTWQGRPSLRRLHQDSLREMARHDRRRACRGRRGRH